MRTTLILSTLLLAGCAGSKPTQRPAVVPNSTPVVREYQSKASRDREASAVDTANLPVEGQLVR